MKKVTIFALIAALAAGVLLYLYLGNLEKKSEVQVRYDTVVVAAADIPAYTTITADLVKVTQAPEGAAHTQSVRDPNLVVGKMTESLILSGEQILPAKLRTPGETASGLSYVIPAGMRALTVAVDDISGVAGFLRQGDYVDILGYVQTSYPAEPYTEDAESSGTTLVVAENILVVALDSALSESLPAESDGSGTEESAYSTATLLVSTADAMRIMQASRSGLITVLLRSTGDHAANTETPVGSDDLLTLEGGVQP